MSMKTRWFAGAVAIMAFVTVGAAQTKDAPKQKDAPKTTTMAGKISDAHCGAGKHTMGTPEQCATACAKDGGYVFVGDKDKVYKIANQKAVSADLAKFAGKAVEMTGTTEGDTVTITKLAAPKGK